jgi:signal transduction histidine kinase
MHALDSVHAPVFLEFPLAENSVFNKILNDKKSLLINDIKEDKNFSSSGWQGYKNGSLLAFPILDSNNTVLGIITLHNKQEPPFLEQDKEIGAILASYCCETIRAINAFETVRESAKKLRQSQKMEAIGTLAGGIAHDFNNILSGIIGYAQLVEMNAGKPENIKKNIDQIMKGTKRASELVTQILTFSRKVEYEKKPLNIYLIVKEAAKFLRSSIPSTIEIIEEINTRSVVMADATQIHQVVMNLCTNAYHSMRDTGGTLLISLSDINIDESTKEKNCEPGLYIKLSIKDTGHGIEEKNLERIFDPYFTTKKISQGTGLGLAVVSGIVKKHNGFTRVLSERGVGTEIQVFFPVVQQLNNKNAKVERLVENFAGSEKIMLVDDEEDILNPTKAILGNMGYKVEGFIDAVSALETFKKDPDGFDLVITDMTMPKMKGNILSEKILTIRKDIPVILCTGYHESFTENDALETGIRRFVQKPVAGKKLASIIREELGK